MPNFTGFDLDSIKARRAVRYTRAEGAPIMWTEALRDITALIAEVERLRETAYSAWEDSMGDDL